MRTTVGTTTTPPPPRRPPPRRTPTHLRDLGGTEGLVQQGVAALGAEGHLHGVGKLVHARQHQGTGLGAKAHFLGSEGAHGAAAGRRSARRDGAGSSASKREHGWSLGHTRHGARSELRTCRNRGTCAAWRRAMPPPPPQHSPAHVVVNDGDDNAAWLGVRGRWQTPGTVPSRECKRRIWGPHSSTHAAPPRAHRQALT